MVKKTEIINTDRLTLREIDESDTDVIVKWRSNPEVYKYFKFAHKITKSEHIEWLNNVYKKNMNRFDWICLKKDNEEKIGVFGLVRTEQKAEINYLLSTDAQHKGYATEAVISLIDYAKKTWNIKMITAEIHKDNLQSILLVKRLGFRKLFVNGEFMVYGYGEDSNDFD